MSVQPNESDGDYRNNNNDNESDGDYGNNKDNDTDK